jgi:kynurenine formamidase
VTVLEYSADGRRWRAELSAPVDLAIPLEFHGAQPRFFAEQPARAEPLRVGDFTGSVAHGASCNCAVHTLAPHCHGTHTECVGHVTDGGTAVAAVTPVAPSLALLVSLRPEVLAEATASPPAHSDASDLCISRRALAAAAAHWANDPWTALVVRTLPNDSAKRHRDYGGGGCPAPYFLVEAMQWVVDRDVQSLVVDLPSLDRADDGGELAAHRTYWGLPRGSVDATQARRGRALVTELAYVPASAPDGLYLLDLQVPAWVADAAPSRPVLFPLAEQHASSAGTVS